MKIEKSRPLLLTLGDPNGLGPEIAVRLLHQKAEEFTQGHPLVLIGPPKALENHCRRLNIAQFWETLSDLTAQDELEPKIYLHSPSALANLPCTPGNPQVQGGLAAGISLDTACAFLARDLARGLVTCPLNKAMLLEAGYAFSGHTEFLARRFGLNQEDVCMHLAGPELRVSLVTTHPPLSRVPELITTEKIIRCLRLTWGLMNKLDRADTPIGVCGLNPHAGEQGTIGTEEERIIAPAIRAAREQGIKAEGPFPADTLFYRARQQEFSSVLAMYHDQGLAPLKLLHFHQAVNVTLGLPCVRTSVDHGTGYDLVGTGRADVSSLEQALHLAVRLLNASKT